ncbi:MAG: glycoside hydrolase family 3, partial [Oscillospiraceae bacterium]|nr:glycoside hydrolase family 3 [Oscillospiraceae bacterium]
GAGSGFLFTSEQLDAADVNRNGVINASDASIILRYAAGTGAEAVEAIFQYWK